MIVRPPAARLAPFVEHLWYYERAFVHTHEVVMPTGRMMLMVDVREASARPAPPFMTGVATEAKTITTDSMQRAVGVSFWPGGAHPFTAAPCHALPDVVTLADLWGEQAAREMRERLLALGEPQAMLAELERLLLARARSLEPSSQVSAALRWLARGVSVREAIERSGASRARFVRTFRAGVGVAPKRYASLARFQRAVRGLARGAVDLAELALDCGYYDQAHFTHEFSRFAGRSPSRYQPRDPAEPNHVIVD
ncbi:MAG: helix-turn-helix transcriptional regulator [Myxococcales bacterium]|nr:helix-turn-helix transcriptional regulator [Myxococcales bacterium]